MYFTLSNILNQRLARELLLWSSLDHENVLPLLGYTIDANHFLSFITEWMEHGHIMVYLCKNKGVDLISLVRDQAFRFQLLTTVA